MAQQQQQQEQNNNNEELQGEEQFGLFFRIFRGPRSCNGLKLRFLVKKIKIIQKTQFKKVFFENFLYVK